MAFAKFEGNRFIIDGEIAKKHTILVDHILFDGEYSLTLRRDACLARFCDRRQR